MSVKVKDRKPTNMEFVDRSRDIVVKVNALVSKRVKNTPHNVIGEKMLEIALESHVNAIIGNSIMIDEDTAEEDYDLRHHYLTLAQGKARAVGALMPIYLDSAINLKAINKKKADKAAFTISCDVGHEINSIVGTMKYDKKTLKDKIKKRNSKLKNDPDSEENKIKEKEVVTAAENNKSQYSCPITFH